MWRGVAAAVAFVLAAVSGLLSAIIAAHPLLGLWVGLGVAVLLGAGLTVFSVAGDRRSRRLPGDHDALRTIRDAAERIRIQELEAARDGKTWPALPDPDSAALGKAINTLGSRTVARSWYYYVGAAQAHARLVRGGRTPPYSEEISARENANRAYTRLMVKLRRFEER
jgi:hypothetical protein